MQTRENRAGNPFGWRKRTPGFEPLCALLTILLTHGTAEVAAQGGGYYRWKDASGNVVLSDRPPESADIEYEIIGNSGPALRRRPTESTGAAAAATTPDGPEAATRSQDIDAESPAPATDAEAVPKDPAACEQARNNLEVLNMKPRIRVYDEQGELNYLTPEQIEEEKAKSRLTIEVHCDR